MPAPVIISYEVFLANVTKDDLNALASLANGEPIKTLSAAEGDLYEAAGLRLKSAGLLLRIRRSLEVISGEDWHVFDGRLDPVAHGYVAKCASERIGFSRLPIPPP
jgi:hypothetical protein